MMTTDDDDASVSSAVFFTIWAVVKHDTSGWVNLLMLFLEGVETASVVRSFVRFANKSNSELATMVMIPSKRR